MSDQTPHDPLEPAEAWPDTPASTPPPADNTVRVAFCQDCGKPLTPETLRAVGTGVFCEPCLMARVAAQNGPQTGTAGYATVPPTGYPTNPFAGPAHPVLAGFLGLIPGVGAMYNGQYAKGFAHLIIFVLLDSISKNVNNVFGAFVFAWVCYQIFDAYHTAKARNEGLPLPNFFGLNDIGEKMGFGKTGGFPAPGSRPAAAPPPPAATGWQTPATPGSPFPSGPDWVGYVPPTNFASTAPPPPAASFVQPPHTETFTGIRASNPYAVPPVPPLNPGWAASSSQGLAPEPFAGRRRFPIGAFWLIGLGVLILLANLVPDWKLTERWWPPVLFAGLSVLIFTRRLHSGMPLIAILRAPVILLVLAILFAIHAAEIYVNFGVFFAVLFITIGLLLVLERTVGAATAHATYSATAEAPRVSFVPASEYPVDARPVPGSEDATKGGL